MNKLIALAIVAGLAAPLAFAQSVNGGNGFLASANTSVQILAPVTASADQFPLNFGKLIVQAAGTVSVDANGILHPTAGVALYTGNTTPVTLPHYYFTHDTAAAVSVVFTPTFSDTLGSFSISPDVQTAASNVSGTGTTGTTTQGLPLYGTLSWTAAPVASKTYTGTIGIAVNYN
jgi:hypothetical protein